MLDLLRRGEGGFVGLLFRAVDCGTCFGINRSRGQAIRLA